MSLLVCGTYLAEVADAIAADPVQSQLSFKVSTQWEGGPKSISRAQPFKWGNESYDRGFLQHSSTNQRPEAPK